MYNCVTLLYTWKEHNIVNQLYYTQSLSRVRLFVAPWTIALQAPLSLGFSRREYWSGLPFPSPGHLPNPGIKPTSPALADGFFTAEPPGKRPDNVVGTWVQTKHNAFINLYSKNLD